MAGSAGQACTDDDVRVIRLKEDGRAEPTELAAKTMPRWAKSSSNPGQVRLVPM